MLSTGPTDHCSVTLHFLPLPPILRLSQSLMLCALYTDYLPSSHGFNFKVERYGHKCLFRSTLVSYKFMDSLFFYLSASYFLLFGFSFPYLFDSPFWQAIFEFSIYILFCFSISFFSFCFSIYILFCFSISFFSFCFSIFVLLWRDQCIIKNCLFLLELQILLQAV